MFIVAQIFGILVIITNVIAMQMKNKEHIIFCFLLANLFSSINFLLLSSYTGAIICVFAIVQIFINNIFNKNNQKIPIFLIINYIILSILLGLITYKSTIDILPIVCSILYTITIIQNKEKRIREITLFNIILWVCFDFSYMAYTAAISDIMMTLSTLIGIYRFDIKKIKE